MEQIQKSIREALSEEILKQVIADTYKAMEANYKAISSKASGMADVHTYQELLDYCYQQVGLYLDNPDNMKKVLLETNNIPTAYHSMTEAEAFKEICTEEYRGFPRVIMMTVLAGSEAAAAYAAAQYFEDNGFDLSFVEYEDRMGATYQKYVKDAIAYGRGGDKKVVFTGEQQ